MTDDQFARWRHAVTTGTRVEWERGDVASGFYKRDAGRGASKPIEAIAIFRDDAGKLQCIRDVYGDGSKLDADQIEELFASCCLYPISEEVYRSVEDGAPWPPEYATRLMMKDQEAGIAWTPEYGRKRLGGEVKPVAKSTEATPAPASPDKADNPRAVIGDNQPPEETPDKAITTKISETAAGVKAWLAEIGGKPRDKAEADKIADYATVFGEFGKSADKQRTEEKKPHLDAGREIDAKWKVPIGAAETARKAALAYVDRFDAEERKRLEAEADQANRMAADAGAEPQAEAKSPGGYGNLRTVAPRSRTVWEVTDPRAYLDHLLKTPGELPAEIIEALGAVARRRGEEAPGVTKDTKRKAA